jgi:hypothetical protein
MQDDEFAESFNVGYDLDGGGYSVDRPEAVSPWAKAATFTYDGDLGYFGIEEPRKHRGHCTMLAIAPNDGHYPEHNFPDAVAGPDEWEGEWRKIDNGAMCASDHGCMWCGPGTGEDEGGDGPEARRPNCTRCDGEGYVDSPGFEWALYAFIDSEDDDA